MNRPTKSKPRRRSEFRRVALVVLLLLLLLPVALFAWNGLVAADDERPITGEVVDVAPSAPAEREVRIVAWNLAKCFVHRGGAAFDSRQQVEARLDRIAGFIRAERPDFVFLSEIVRECTPCDVDQVLHLARATGMRHWAFGENYNFGLPFVRIVGGNAILSRSPLAAVGNPDLIGRRPFWLTRNSRRLLLCEATVGGRETLLGCVHTDSFDLDNNLRQTEQILALTAGRPTILAGDFNAEPTTRSIDSILRSDRFVGAIDGPATYPARAPSRRIDYVFAPTDWVLREHRVVGDATSDHLGVVAVYAIR